MTIGELREELEDWPEGDEIIFGCEEREFYGFKKRGADTVQLGSTRPSDAPLENPSSYLKQTLTRRRKYSGSKLDGARLMNEHRDTRYHHCPCSPIWWRRRLLVFKT
jgi:hypothetical protein